MSSVANFLTCFAKVLIQEPASLKVMQLEKMRNRSRVNYSLVLYLGIAAYSLTFPYLDVVVANRLLYFFLIVLEISGRTSKHFIRVTVRLQLF